MPGHAHILPHHQQQAVHAAAAALQQQQQQHQQQQHQQQQQQQTQPNMVRAKQILRRVTSLTEKVLKMPRTLANRKSVSKLSLNFI